MSNAERIRHGDAARHRGNAVDHNQTRTWDPYGNLLTTVSGAPFTPAPIAVYGTQTIYARNDLGIYTGTDSALPGGGFVYTLGPHYSWLTPNSMP